MSLFIGLEIQNNEWVIGVDSRKSIEYNGVTYCAGDMRKYIIHNGELIIALGEKYAIDKFLDYCDNHTDEPDIEKIFNITVDNLSDSFIEHCNPTSDNLVLAIFKVDMSKKEILALYYTNALKKVKEYHNMKMFCCAGIMNDKAGKFIQDNIIGKDGDVLEAMTAIFDFVNCTQIGGKWTVFHLTDTQVKQIGTYISSDIGVNFAPNSINTYGEIMEKYFQHGIIQSGTSILGADFWNKEQTTKLTLGMNGNLGDLTLTRAADDTQVFQVYDNATNTGLKCRDKQFLYTTGAKTYMQGDWTYNGYDIATNKQIEDLQTRISELEAKIQNT